MIEVSTRRSPPRSIVFAMILPGYVFWQDNKKIESVSLTIATLLGYFIGIGVLLHIYLLYYTWKSNLKHNRMNGFETLSKAESKNIMITGTVAGIFSHPLYLLLTYFWLIQLDFVRYNSNNNIMFSPFYLVCFLLLVFSMRYLLYYYIKTTLTKDQGAELIAYYPEFARNNASMIYLLPLFSLMLLAQSELIASIFLFASGFGTLVFGTRTFYNNLTTLSTKS